MNSRANYLRFLLLASFWGGSFVAIKFVVNEVPPFFGAMLRVGVAMVFLTLLFVPAKRPLYVPVYLADSLFLPTEVRQSLINGTETEIRFGLSKDRAFFLPSTFLDSASQFDAAIRLSQVKQPR